MESAIRDGSGRKIETKYVRTINGIQPENGNVNVNPLFDKTYDFSKNESIYKALGDLIVALGGNVINMPEKE